MTKIKSYLLYLIDYYELQGYGFCNINEMIMKTKSDKHQMTHNFNIQYPMQLIEKRMNLVIDRCPELIKTLDFLDDHPIYRKYSHINEYY